MSLYKSMSGQGLGWIVRGQTLIRVIMDRKLQCHVLSWHITEYFSKEEIQLWLENYTKEMLANCGYFSICKQL